MSTFWKKCQVGFLTANSLERSELASLRKTTNIWLISSVGGVKSTDSDRLQTCKDGNASHRYISLFLHTELQLELSPKMHVKALRLHQYGGSFTFGSSGGFKETRHQLRL